MKFYIRRALVGIVSIPIVAGLYTFGYLCLVIAGAEPNASIREVVENGLWLGGLVAVMFTFSPQISKFLDNLVGE
jgi:hypothetical protein